MPLTVPQGYTITIGQFRHGKPHGVIECQVCPGRETFDVPLDDVCATGTAINTAIGRWLTHSCPGDVVSNMQDAPAGVPW